MTPEDSPPIPRLGTMIRAARGAADSIRALLPHGFESWQLSFPLKREPMPCLTELAGEVQEAVAGTGTVISALGIYGNPLRDDAMGAETRRAIREAIASVRLFGTDLIGCFAGRVPGQPIDR